MLTGEVYQPLPVLFDWENTANKELEIYNKLQLEKEN
jgi:hypothetical protein